MTVNAQFKGIRILVTGGAGYLGSVLTRVLLEERFHVTVIDNWMYHQTSLWDCCLFDHFEVVYGDCRDKSLVASLVKTADVIIPLAAIVGAPACSCDSMAAETTNVGAIRLLCQLASPSQRIVFPTSNSGYGIGEKSKVCTEETPLRPISLYGQTKVEAEKIILERGNSISLRLATVFGVSPRMRTDLLINDFVYRAVKDRALVVFEGQFRRNYIHIRDVAKAFLYSLENFDVMKNQIFNVGLEDSNLSKIEVCRLIQKLIPQFVYMEDPIGEDPDKRDYIVSNAKLMSTGYKPDWTLEKGIRELVKCYRTGMRSSHANI